MLWSYNILLEGDSKMEDSNVERLFDPGTTCMDEC